MELSIVNETKKIVEEAMNNYYINNKKYYSDVLDFINKLFNENAKSILKIKFKKITLSYEIFEMYNNIILKYKLSKNLFDTQNFNINNVYNFSEIIEIANTMTNNLLDKLNYKIYQIEFEGKKKLKIKINNEI
jgi:hypothetical protein